MCVSGLPFYTKLQGLHCRVKLRPLNHSLTEDDTHKIAAASHGYVGADISALCQEAAMCALRRHVAAQESFREASEQRHQASAVASQNSTEAFSLEDFSTAQADATKPGLQVKPYSLLQTCGRLNGLCLNYCYMSLRESVSASTMRSSAHLSALHWLSM